MLFIFVYFIDLWGKVIQMNYLIYNYIFNNPKYCITHEATNINKNVYSTQGKGKTLYSNRLSDFHSLLSALR